MTVKCESAGADVLRKSQTAERASHGLDETQRFPRMHNVLPARCAGRLELQEEKGKKREKEAEGERGARGRGRKNKEVARKTSRALSANSSALVSYYFPIKSNTRTRAL